MADFYTIGHSTRSTEEFVELLQRCAIQKVVDVRAIPRSRTNPQFNAEQIVATLSMFDIGYEHIPSLGGRRSKSAVPARVNAFWRNQSFHNYADYAMSVEFRLGLARLRELGHARKCALMCAETVWWRCHRRIVADYLIAAGDAVSHILGPNSVVPASLTKGAMVETNGIVIYPASGEAKDLHSIAN